MALANDIATAISTATTAINSVGTQLALLESYRVTDPKAFYDAGGFAVGALANQWANTVKLPLDSLVRGK